MSDDGQRRSTGLWRNPDFLKLWGGQTVSLVGSQVTNLALPLTAVITLQATPLQMGLLAATQYAPFLIFGLPVGVWVDRLPRRPILIFANLGRALVLGCIPLAAFLNLLRIEYLFVVGFAAGVLTVFFNVAYQSFFPTIVEREHLVEGNSKLQVSVSVANVVGPGLGGMLVQWMAAPLAVLADAFSFLVSAFSISLIRKPERRPALRGARQGLWGELREGLSALWANPLLRALLGCTGVSNFCINVHVAVRLLYATRVLHLEPATLGLIFTAGSVGGLPAALLAKRLARRFGTGPTIIGAQVLIGLGALFLPLAGGSRATTIAVITMGLLLWVPSMMIYDINQISLRQAIVPNHLLGRINATIRFVTLGVAPLGAVLGGALGEFVGLRITMLAAGVGVLLAALIVLFSPVRTLRQHPETAPELEFVQTSGRPPDIVSGAPRRAASAGGGHTSEPDAA